MKELLREAINKLPIEQRDAAWKPFLENIALADSFPDLTGRSADWTRHYILFMTAIAHQLEPLANKYGAECTRLYSSDASYTQPVQFDHWSSLKSYEQ